MPNDLHQPFISPGYTAMMVAGLVVGALVWGRRVGDRPEMVVVLASGLVGAFLGAKAGYVLAEAWTVWGDAGFWRSMLVGKTVVGALLGGYGGVELGKRWVGVREHTGDAFAIAVPAGLALGRIGCLMHGCCRGVACDHDTWWAVADHAALDAGLAYAYYYPAAVVELVFNLGCAAVLLLLRRAGAFPGNLFHLYLIGYGLFRLAHEPLRATPKLVPGVSVYSLLALGLVGLGVLRWRQRRVTRDQKPASKPADACTTRTAGTPRPPAG